jgi:hypothetical protein
MPTRSRRTSHAWRSSAPAAAATSSRSSRRSRRSGRRPIRRSHSCSAYDPTIWIPPAYLAPDDPLIDQPVNLRCFYNKQTLYPIDRYLNGYRGVHAGDGARVLFAAIAGIPVELVDQNARAKVDFGDEAQRETFYQTILDDPRMKEAPDPDASTPSEELKPACESAHGRAYPARRIVELARGFGQAGLVQSICGDNFGPPTDIILRKLAGPD